MTVAGRIDETLARELLADPRSSTAILPPHKALCR